MRAQWLGVAVLLVGCSSNGDDGVTEVPPIDDAASLDAQVVSEASPTVDASGRDVELDTARHEDSAPTDAAQDTVADVRIDGLADALGDVLEDVSDDARDSAPACLNATN